MYPIQQYEITQSQVIYNTPHPKSVQQTSTPKTDPSKDVTLSISTYVSGESRIGTAWVCKQAAIKPFLLACTLLAPCLHLACTLLALYLHFACKPVWCRFYFSLYFQTYIYSHWKCMDITVCKCRIIQEICISYKRFLQRFCWS